MACRIAADGISFVQDGAWADEVDQKDWDLVIDALDELKEELRKRGHSDKL